MSNFMTTKGKAQGAYLERKDFKNGENLFRIVGNILRRYGYWLKTPAGNAVFMECLSFDRELEKFTNKEKDHVVDFYPDATDFYGNVITDPKTGKKQAHRPKWAYVATVLDRDDDSKIKELNLKKTLFEDLLKICAKKHPQTKQPFGDPTDPITGWDILVTKEKTGPGAMNVKYTVDAFSPISGICALTEAEIALVADTPSAEVRHERASADEQLELLQKIASGEYDREKADKKGNANSTADSAGSTESHDTESMNELS